MKPEIKAQWLEALRSGKYAQTKAALQTAEGFCCLGVLCDLYSKETGTEWEPPRGDNGKFKVMLGSSGGLPGEVMKWSGVLNRYGALPEWFPKDRDDYNFLANLNDSGMPFNQIADIIEYAL